MKLELVNKKIMSRDKNRTFRKSFGHNCRAQNPKKSLSSKTLWKTLITETSNLSSILPEKKGKKKLWKTTITGFQTSLPNLPKKKDSTLENCSYRT
jgi:hypothetical protein